MNDEVFQSGIPYRSTILTITNESNTIRRCTDSKCLSFNIILILITISLCLWYEPRAYKHFNNSFDSTHQPCVYPYKYVYIPYENSSKSVCVTSCPAFQGIPLTCKLNNFFPVCPHSISKLIRNQRSNTCRHPNSSFKQQNIFKTFMKIVINNQAIIIKTAIYCAVGSFALITLILLFPQMMAYLCILLFDLILIALALIGFYKYLYSRTIFDMYIPHHFKSTGILMIISLVLFTLGLVSLLSLCFKSLTSQQISKVVIIIRIARICIFNNLYLPLLVALLNAMTIGVFMLNIYCFKVALGLVKFNKNHLGPLDQVQLTPFGIILVLLLCFQFLWFHGFIISLSHWLLQAIATFWYCSPIDEVYGLQPLFSSFKLTGIHLGTITIGTYYSYYSHSLANFANNIESNCHQNLYNCFCCIHNCCCRYLHIYSYIQTILKSLSFWEANIELYHIRRRMRVNFPSIYMLGYFFNRSTKNLVIFLSLLFCYWLLLTQSSSNRIIWYIMPIIIASWFIVTEIATPWISLIGIIADTISINYYIEVQNNIINQTPDNPLSCNPKLAMLLQQIDISFDVYN